MRMSFAILVGVSVILLGGEDRAVIAQAGPAQVGVVLQGGPYYAALEGLRDGLKQLGLQEGKEYQFDIRDSKGDLAAAEQMAADLAAKKVKLIYALSGSISNAVQKATNATDMPIVFVVGSDPVELHLVQSLAQPGGRLTGVHFLQTDLTAKRLQILKELVPRLKSVVIFFDPSNKGAADAARFAHEAGSQLGVDIVERHVASVDELKRSLQALKQGEVDAYFFTSDARVTSQAALIIEAAKAKMLPTMFHEQTLVAQGALASYGLSYREIGRLSARYVQRILAGASPRTLPVEQVDKLEMVVNLQTAKALGLKIPQSLLLQADKVY